MFRRLSRLLRRIGAIPPMAIKGPKKSVAINRPRLIEHPEYISIGAGTLIREYGWLSPIPMESDIRYHPQLVIGDGVYIGRYCCITCIGEVTIGDGCVLSEHVYVADSGHGVDPAGGPIMRQPLQSKGPVRIGANTFVGYGARILPGVTLGRHCVVGANAVVTRSFDDYTMVAGVPAKAIKRYNIETQDWEAIG